MRGSRLRIIEEIETFTHTSHSSLPGSFVQILINNVSFSQKSALVCSFAVIYRLFVGQTGRGDGRRSRRNTKNIMENPWLHIPASDYEGHMSNPHIAQQQFLAQTFQDSLHKHNQTSIAILGCTTGNGLEFINSDATERVTAIDLNPEYLNILRQRYKNSVAGLEVIEADLETCVLDPSTYTLIFAGLIFEYVDPQILLPKIRNWLSENGVLVSILQLPSENLAKVSVSSYESLKTLAPIMKLVTPSLFTEIAEKSGLQELETKIVSLASGKSFFIGTYSRSNT